MIKILLLFLSVTLIDSKIYQVLSMFRHGARYYLDKYYDYNTTYWG